MCLTFICMDAKMTDIKKITYKPIEKPLRTLFTTALGQKSVMQSVIVKVTLDDGRHVLGEIPTSFVLKQETIPNISAILEKTVPTLINRPADDDFSSEIQILRKKYPNNPMTASGLEIALFRAGLAAQNTDEHAFWGKKRSRIATDITIPYTTNSDELEKWMRFVVPKNFDTYKVKISGHIDDDLQLLTRVRDYLTPRRDTFTIRVDGNQGYTSKSFPKLIDRLEKQHLLNYIELIEQPLPKHDYKGLAEIKKQSPLPIVLDETVFSSADMDVVLDRDLGHGINIKFAKSGVAESAKLIKIAKKNKLKLMIGCMTETMIGLSAGIYCAAGTGAFDYIDLDGVFFLFHSNARQTIKIKGPEFIL